MNRETDEQLIDRRQGMDESPAMGLEDLLKVGVCANRISAKVMDVVNKACGKRITTAEDLVFLTNEVQKLVHVLEPTTGQLLAQTAHKKKKKISQQELIDKIITRHELQASHQPDSVPLSTGCEGEGHHTPDSSYSGT